MKPSTTRMVLRYRPGPDVLTGWIDSDARAGRPQQLDADTSLQWHHDPAEADQALLGGFQVLHAHRRERSDGLQVLPEALRQPARALIDGARQQAQSATGATLGLYETTIVVPTASLQRRRAGDSGSHPSTSRGSDDVDRGRRVGTGSATAFRPLGPKRSTSARHHRPNGREPAEPVAVALAQALDRLSQVVADGDAGREATALADTLGELAATIGTAHGRRAPATSAAARHALAAARGLDLVAAGELAAILVDVDDPSTWTELAPRIEQVRTRLSPPTDR